MSKITAILRTAHNPCVTTLKIFDIHKLEKITIIRAGAMGSVTLKN